MIKTLAKAQQQERVKFRVPRSVQDAIPIRRIWSDGIFLCGNQYSKTWSFTDINYAIAGKDDKTAMFLDYSRASCAAAPAGTRALTQTAVARAQTPSKKQRSEPRHTQPPPSTRRAAGRLANQTKTDCGNFPKVRWFAAGWLNWRI